MQDAAVVAPGEKFITAIFIFFTIILTYLCAVVAAAGATTLTAILLFLSKNFYLSVLK